MHKFKRALAALTASAMLFSQASVFAPAVGAAEVSSTAAGYDWSRLPDYEPGDNTAWLDVPRDIETVVNPDVTGASVEKAEFDNSYPAADDSYTSIPSSFGESFDPEVSEYYITSIDDLKEFRDRVNGTYFDASIGDTLAPNDFCDKIIYLVRDIDLGGQEWTPIGVCAKPDINPFGSLGIVDNRFNSIPQYSDYFNEFDGTFDGLNHKISNLCVSDKDGYFSGFFGYTNDCAEIRNLHIVDGDVKGKYWTGGVAGFMRSGALRNCSFSGSVEGYFFVGGIFGGQYWEDNGVIYGPTYIGPSHSNRREDFEVIDCRLHDGSDGSAVNVKGVYGVGGIGGYAGQIELSYSSDANIKADVRGVTAIGGIMGAAGANEVTGWMTHINGTSWGDLYFMAYDFSGFTVSGSVGYDAGFDTGTIDDRYFAPAYLDRIDQPDGYERIVPGQYVGGVIGYTGYVYESNAGNSGYNYACAATEHMKYGGISDSSDCLSIDHEHSFDRVRNLSDIYVDNAVGGADFSGGIAGQFLGKLDNISVSPANLSIAPGSDFVGSLVGRFTGYNDYCVQDITIRDDISLSGGSYVGGLFGFGDAQFFYIIDWYRAPVLPQPGDAIRGYRLTFDNVALPGSISVEGDDFVGGLVGRSQGLYGLSDAFPSNRLNVSVKGNNYVGGVSGYAASPNIPYGDSMPNERYEFDGIIVEGSVSGDTYVGGLFGYYVGMGGPRSVSADNGVYRQRSFIIGGAVTGCRNDAAVSGQSYVGGIAGRAASYNYANLPDAFPYWAYELAERTNFASFYETVLYDRYVSTGSAGSQYSYDTRLYVENCMNAGSVSGDVSNIGGIAGSNDLAVIFGCYNCGAIDAPSADYVGGIAGRSDSSNYASKDNNYYAKDNKAWNWIYCVGRNLYFGGYISLEPGEGNMIGSAPIEKFGPGFNGVVMLIDNDSDDGDDENFPESDDLYGIEAINEDSVPFDGGISVYVGSIASSDALKVDAKHKIITAYARMNGSIYTESTATIIYALPEMRECLNVGDVRGHDFVGGVTGEANDHLGISTNGTTFSATSDRYSRIANDGSVEGHDHVGGVSGEFGGRLGTSLLRNTGSVSGDFYVGGLAGSFDGLIDIAKSFNSGDVSGDSKVGGLAGYVGANFESMRPVVCNPFQVTGDSKAWTSTAGKRTSRVNNSYNAGRIDGKSYVGGLIGFADTDETYDLDRLGVYNSVITLGGLTASGMYSLCDLSALFGDSIHHFFGYLGEVSTVSNCFVTEDLANDIADLGYWNKQIEDPFDLDYPIVSDYEFAVAYGSVSTSFGNSIWVNLRKHQTKWGTLASQRPLLRENLEAGAMDLHPLDLIEDVTDYDSWRAFWQSCVAGYDTYANTWLNPRAYGSSNYDWAASNGYSNDTVGVAYDPPQGVVTIMLWTPYDEDESGMKPDAKLRQITWTHGAGMGGAYSCYDGILEGNGKIVKYTASQLEDEREMLLEDFAHGNMLQIYDIDGKAKYPAYVHDDDWNYLDSEGRVTTDFNSYVLSSDYKTWTPREYRYTLHEIGQKGVMRDLVFIDGSPLACNAYPYGGNYGTDSYNYGTIENVVAYGRGITCFNYGVILNCRSVSPNNLAGTDLKGIFSSGYDYSDYIYNTPYGSLYPDCRSSDLRGVSSYNCMVQYASSYNDANYGIIDGCAVEDGSLLCLQGSDVSEGRFNSRDTERIIRNCYTVNAPLVYGIFNSGTIENCFSVNALYLIGLAHNNHYFGFGGRVSNCFLYITDEFENMLQPYLDIKASSPNSGNFVTTPRLIGYYSASTSGSYSTEGKWDWIRYASMDLVEYGYEDNIYGTNGFTKQSWVKDLNQIREGKILNCFVNGETASHDTIDGMFPEFANMVNPNSKTYQWARIGTQYVETYSVDTVTDEDFASGSVAYRLYMWNKEVLGTPDSENFWGQFVAEDPSFDNADVQQDPYPVLNLGGVAAYDDRTHPRVHKITHDWTEVNDGNAAEAVDLDGIEEEIREDDADIESDEDDIANGGVLPDDANQGVIIGGDDPAGDSGEDILDQDGEADDMPDEAGDDSDEPNIDIGGDSDSGNNDARSDVPDISDDAIPDDAIFGDAVPDNANQGVIIGDTVSDNNYEIAEISELMLAAPDGDPEIIDLFSHRIDPEKPLIWLWPEDTETTLTRYATAGRRLAGLSFGDIGIDESDSLVWMNILNSELFDDPQKINSDGLVVPTVMDLILTAYRAFDYDAHISQPSGAIESSRGIVKIWADISRKCDRFVPQSISYLGDSIDPSETSSVSVDGSYTITGTDLSDLELHKYYDLDVHWLGLTHYDIPGDDPDEKFEGEIDQDNGKIYVRIPRTKKPKSRTTPNATGEGDIDPDDILPDDPETPEVVVTNPDDPDMKKIYEVIIIYEGEDSDPEPKTLELTRYRLLGHEGDIDQSKNTITVKLRRSEHPGKPVKPDLITYTADSIDPGEDTEIGLDDSNTYTLRDDDDPDNTRSYELIIEWIDDDAPLDLKLIRYKLLGHEGEIDQENNTIKIRLRRSEHPGKPVKPDIVTYVADSIDPDENTEIDIDQKIIYTLLDDNHPDNVRDYELIIDWIEDDEPLDLMIIEYRLLGHDGDIDQDRNIIKIRLKRSEDPKTPVAPDNIDYIADTIDPDQDTPIDLGEDNTYTLTDTGTGNTREYDLIIDWESDPDPVTPPPANIPDDKPDDTPDSAPEKPDVVPDIPREPDDDIPDDSTPDSEPDKPGNPNTGAGLSGLAIGVGAMTAAAIPVIATNKRKRK